MGSIVCGPADLMQEVRYLRKRLGGGMRQAGVIAAAARVALANRERLAEDHALAGYLAESLAERFPGSVDPSAVETNMVQVRAEALKQPFGELRRRLSEQGIETGPAMAGVWRLVTHRDVDRADVDRLVAAI